jgi:hypothetical protein
MPAKLHQVRVRSESRKIPRGTIMSKTDALCDLKRFLLMERGANSCMYTAAKAASLDMDCHHPHIHLLGNGGRKDGPSRKQGRRRTTCLGSWEVESERERQQVAERWWSGRAWLWSELWTLLWRVQKIFVLVFPCGNDILRSTVGSWWSSSAWFSADHLLRAHRENRSCQYFRYAGVASAVMARSL